MNLVVSSHSTLKARGLTQLLSHIASRCTEPSHERSLCFPQCPALFQWHQIAEADKRRKGSVASCPRKIHSTTMNMVLTLCFTTISIKQKLLSLGELYTFLFYLLMNTMRASVFFICYSKIYSVYLTQ